MELRGAAARIVESTTSRASVETNAMEIANWVTGRRRPPPGISRRLVLSTTTTTTTTTKLTKTQQRKESSTEKISNAEPRVEYLLSSFSYLSFCFVYLFPSWLIFLLCSGIKWFPDNLIFDFYSCASRMTCAGRSASENQKQKIRLATRIMCLCCGVSRLQIRATIIIP
jgi:hypothetical protein